MHLKMLVNKGKITEEQKAAIEAKRAELKESREEARAELQQWAKDNDINLKYLMLHRGYFGQHYYHHHYKHVF